MRPGPSTHPLNDWTGIGHDLAQGNMSPRFAPGLDELAVHRAGLQRVGGMSRRALVLGATPELTQLALSLGMAVLRVDSCPEMFAAARPRETWGPERQVVDMHADWRDLGEIPAASVDVILGDAALNNVAVDDTDHVLAQLRRVLRPGGVLSVKEIVHPETWCLPPDAGTNVPELAWVLARHREGVLSQREFRTLARFWCFRGDAYDGPRRLLRGDRVHGAVLREQARGTFTDDEAAHLIATRSPLQHTIHEREDLKARLTARFGSCRVQHAGPQFHQRNLFQIFVAGAGESGDSVRS